MVITTDGIIVGTELYFNYERDIKSQLSGQMLMAHNFFCVIHLVQFCNSTKQSVCNVFLISASEVLCIQDVMCGLKLK